MQKMKMLATSMALVLVSSSAFSDFGSWTRNKSPVQAEEQLENENDTEELKEPVAQVKPEIKNEKKPVFTPPVNKQIEIAPNKSNPVQTYTPPAYTPPPSPQSTNDQMEREAAMEISRFNASMATMKSIEANKNPAITAEQRIALSVLNATLMQAEYDSSAQTHALYSQAIGCVNSYGNQALNNAAQKLVNSKINTNASRVIYGSPSIGSNYSQKCVYQQ